MFFRGTYEINQLKYLNFVNLLVIRKSLELILLLISVFFVAILYSSVGHGGASGYLAVLTIAGLSIVDIKSSALILNIIVSSTAFIMYFKAGHFKWKLFYPFAITSIPFAFIGALFDINPTLYKQILGVCLLIAVLKLIGVFGKKKTNQIKEIPLLYALIIGSVLGFVSGIIGIGGGIILSPLILFFSWANEKQTSATSALFILVNSMAALVGVFKNDFKFENHFLVLICIAVLGGIIGSYWGSTKAMSKTLNVSLGIVLTFAALKLIFI